MNKRKGSTGKLLFLAALFLLLFPVSKVRAEEAEVPVYRLYFRPTQEHLYTIDANEKEVLSTQGAWIYEGIGWYAPVSGRPVYRLYFPGTGDHLYTADANEYAVLPGFGWQQEGICWYSADENAVPVYRLFCPGLRTGSHHFTTDSYERSVLIGSGTWTDEQVGWYALRTGGAYSRPAMQLSVTEQSLSEGTFSLALTNVWAPGGAASVQFAVWVGDDWGSLYWYTPQQTEDGTRIVTVNGANHRALHGVCHAAAFVTGGDGVTDLVSSVDVDDPFREMDASLYTTEMVRARAYLASVTTPEMTQEQKLRAAFLSYRGQPERNPWVPHYTGWDWPERYANNYFDTHIGNCFSYATSFAYMAKVLGYENVVVCRASGHGWVEINGLVYDPEYSKFYSDVSYYAMPYSASARNARYQRVTNYGQAARRTL